MAVTIMLPEYRPVYYEKFQKQKEPLNALTATVAAEVNTIQTSFNESVTASVPCGDEVGCLECETSKQPAVITQQTAH